MSTKKLTIELFVSSHCPHCTQALELLTTAVKHGGISELKIINLNTLSNTNAYPHIRSVPFIQIGDFEFPGELKKTELDGWMLAQKEGNFASYYFASLFLAGQFNQAEHLIKRKPDYWLNIIKLAQNTTTKMQVRIGITALFESLSNEFIKTIQVDEMISSLIEATNTSNHAIRVDLVYLLSLIYSTVKSDKNTHSALNNFINTTANDPSDEIKEIIEDVLS
ncbi:hypothetical protein MNBD_GAMMA23-252 [hydrothermal vent metagenome]|uniref:Thioredoxin-like fold domain-containing protein n=1 Tax=hydrothermal vent metagenome TaxID=652676 RepID=A0A3B0ZVU4_9ZZZZ